ncbi:MAG: helicase C-terminal domain-containing protein [bacterium]
MKHLKHLGLLESFPFDLYPEVKENQQVALDLIERQGGSVTLELPTGTGKTAIGYTFLKDLEKQGKGPSFYIVPTKALVEQVQTLHPDVQVAYGRGEHPCFYYEPKEDLSPRKIIELSQSHENLKANEIPCSMLVDCPHRVDQETGMTHTEGAVPCSYLWQKYEAKKGKKIVVCTTAFYLFTQLFSKEFEKPVGLVIDEAHGIAATVRNCLSYDISDWHLQKAIEFLTDIAPEAAEQLEKFLATMVRIVKRRPSRTTVLLEDHEIEELMYLLTPTRLEYKSLRKKVQEAIKDGQIDTKEKREVLKKIESLTYNLVRYYLSLEYSLPDKKRHALNYTYAYYKEKLGENERVQHTLTIKAYYVAPIIQRIISPSTVAYSATIGDSTVFGFETGIKSPFYALPSEFPVENTRVYLPLDTPNLAVKERSHREPTHVLRRIAKTCHRFNKVGIRCLVVVVSNKEREKFLWLCGKDEENINVISYGNGTRPKEALARFKSGEGDVLIGTDANYGEGLDLPNSIAQVIFSLRPGYPSPNDPATIFEERRFGNRRWSLWNWREMLKTLQVRGRNIRSTECIGVTIFISQQYRRFIPNALPEWLRKAFRGDMTFDQCIDDALKMLK